jgi:hypothetical protein
MTVTFQSAPVFLPAVGLLLSPISTMPIAMAAYLNLSLGLSVYLASGLILLAVSLQEASILFFTTGILGFVTGALVYRKGMVISISSSGIALSAGLMCLTYIIGIPSFHDFAEMFPSWAAVLIFFVFSFIYAGLWNIFLRKLIQYLRKVKIINKDFLS